MKFLIKAGVYAVVIVGLFIVYGGVSSFWEGTGSERWPTVEGKIIKSEVEERSAYIGGSWRQEKYSVILYGYEVVGVQYTNSRITWDGSYPDSGDSLARQFPLGRKVKVHYEPQSPDNSVLFPVKRSIGRILGTVLMGICLTGLGVFGARHLHKSS